MRFLLLVERKSMPKSMANRLINHRLTAIRRQSTDHGYHPVPSTGITHHAPDEGGRRKQRKGSTWSCVHRSSASCSAPAGSPPTVRERAGRPSCGARRAPRRAGPGDSLLRIGVCGGVHVGAAALLLVCCAVVLRGCVFWAAKRSAFPSTVACARVAGPRRSRMAREMEQVFRTAQ
jgi:hypothetical protein